MKDMHLMDQPPTLWVTVVTDPQTLFSCIKEAQKANLPATNLLGNKESTDNPQWSKDKNGTLYYDRQVFVPNTGDLCLLVINSRHDHVLARHLGQSKTYQLICWDYNWPNLQKFVVNYIRSCYVCDRNKARHHKPYGLLKQLPIPHNPRNPSLWISSNSYHHQKAIWTF